MAQKAKIFKDQEAQAKVMAESEPVVIKQLGKNIKGFDEVQWRSEAQQIMETGLRAKFSQNQYLAKTLLETGTKHILEASTDPYWGAGVTLHSDQLFESRAWTGENVLGKALMKVRSDLTEYGLIDLDTSMDDQK